VRKIEQDSDSETNVAHWIVSFVGDAEEHEVTEKYIGRLVESKRNRECQEHSDTTVSKSSGDNYDYDDDCQVPIQYHKVNKEEKGLLGSEITAKWKYQRGGPTKHSIHDQTTSCAASQISANQKGSCQVCQSN
jgi:hypothetical protein